MNPIVKNILAVVGGWLIGSIVNMGLVQAGMAIITPPFGFNVEVPETFALLGTKDLVFPFLAHALGTLVGAFAAAKISATRSLIMSMIVGVIFFIGGSYMAMNYPAPSWFNYVDLILAYFPMAWIGHKLATK